MRHARDSDLLQTNQCCHVKYWGTTNFLCPLYIHDSSDFETYSNFFNHLKTKLTDTSRLVFGSDEEKAFVNAITTAFRNSEHMLCKRHLYQNTKQKLVNDCVDKTDRQDLQ
jgi:transposase-like protein